MKSGRICLDNLVIRVRYCDVGIATRSNVTLYIRLSMRLWSVGGGRVRLFMSCNITVSLAAKL